VLVDLKHATSFEPSAEANVPKPCSYLGILPLHGGLLWQQERGETDQNWSEREIYAGSERTRVTREKIRSMEPLSIATTENLTQMAFA
jgi:hypothetical protein